LAKAADQFRSSDVTVWGVVALCCWGFAVLSANVSGLLPGNMLAALHASRLEGGTVNQLRAQVAAVEAETSRMRRENNLLLQRLDVAAEAQSAVTQRVGALEVSLPAIVERLPESVAIDDSVTASISGGKPLSFEADGGSVTVEQKPLVAITTGVQPIPGGSEVADDAQVADGSAYGVALGFPIEPADGEVQWQGLMGKVGTLLIGLWPVLGEVEGSNGKIVVAGPIVSEAQAAELCGRLEKVGIPCKPAPFKGDPLPMLN
jgi:hypothetical protein